MIVLKHPRFIPAGEMTEMIPENHTPGRPYEIPIDNSFDTTTVTGAEEIEYEMIDTQNMSNRTRV